MQRPREVKVFLGSMCLNGLRLPDQNRFQWMKEYLLFQKSEAMNEHGKSYTMIAMGFYPWQLAVVAPQNNSCDPDIFSVSSGGSGQLLNHQDQKGETVVSNSLSSFNFLLTHF